MRRVLFGLTGVICFFIIETGVGQAEDADLYGYVEPQISVAEVNKETKQMTSLKLRLDLEAALSDRMTFQGNFNYITRHGDKTWHLVDFLSDDIKNSLFPGARDLFIYSLDDECFVDNAFLKITFDRFDLTIGRQQISPGAGYAWNPTDVFNSKNLLDPTYEQRGHDALRVDIPSGLNGTVMLLYSPEDKDYTSGKFAGLKYNISHFEVMLMGGERTHRWKDYSTLKDVNETRKIIGGDIVGELLGMGVWLELAWNDMEISEGYFEGLFGFDYTFEGGLYLLNEFYRNERGKSDYREYTFTDWMSYFATETKSITRDQWFFYISYPATDLLTIGTSVITSLNDWSLVLVPTAEYNFLENLDVTVFGNFYFGDDGETYSPLLGQGGLVRLRYYF